jgi:hypothetical protein
LGEKVLGSAKSGFDAELSANRVPRS